MKKKAQKVLEILENHYLDMYGIKICPQIVTLEKPIDYLMGEPNQAVKVIFKVNKQHTESVEECFFDVLDFFYEFRTVIIDNVEQATSKYDKVTCLLVFK